MTIRPRAARALLDARTKLRDIAAVAHARDAATRHHSHLAVVDEHTRLAAHLDDAADLMAAASSVWDLTRVDEDTGVHRLAIVDAEQRHQDADLVSKASEAKLRDSARRLRTAEAIVDKLRTERDESTAKAEQRANDDIAASTTRRK